MSSLIVNNFARYKWAIASFIDLCLFYEIRSVESFLKKGIAQKDAHRRFIEYEERRKMNVELVLKDMMITNSRSNNRKATSVLK